MARMPPSIPRGGSQSARHSIISRGGGGGGGSDPQDPPLHHTVVIKAFVSEIAEDYFSQKVRLQHGCRKRGGGGGGGGGGQGGHRGHQEMVPALEDH